MLFHYAFIEVEFIEDRASAGSKSKLNKRFQKLIKKLGKRPSTPWKKEFFVAVVLTFSDFSAF